MKYHNYDKKNLSDLSDNSIEEHYDNGYLFTRTGRGDMIQTISLRIDLNDFELNSENRRIIRKTDWFDYNIIELPIPEDEYDYSIQKIGKDFYFEKNKKKVFSANKIKELLTDPDQSNFNKLFVYSDKESSFGYSILLETQNIIHYAYPFYDLNKLQPNIGMGMIVKALSYTLDNNKKYFYLGSVTSTKAFYKLQFNNMEWYNGQDWSRDIDKLKQLVEKLQ